MGAPANSAPRRRRVFWVLAAYCLALIAAVPWSVTHAIHLLNGPSVTLPGDGYSAVAVAPDGHTLYAANPGPVSDDSGHTVTPVDIATGKAARPITVGKGPQDLTVTPDGRMLYALLADGTITPVSLATGRTMSPIHVTSGAAAMAVSPDSRTLFIGTGNNEVVAVDIATGRRESLIPLPTPGSGVVSPAALAVTPDGRTLYVAEYDDDTVIPVNLATGRPGAPIIIEAAVLGLESALAITPDGRTLYAAVNGDYGGGSGPNSLVAISTATGTVEQTVNFGTAGPIALAVTPDGRTLYALNGNYSDGIVPGTSTITPVSTADDRLGGAVRTGGLFSHASAFGFAVAPDGRTVYVAQGDVVAVALPR
jgi:DNA-binding beta-propeller fold protein YncE